MSSIPPSPNILAPANGTAFAEATQTILLSWSAVPGAGVYNVRVQDLTEPDLRHPGNNCVQDKHYVCVNGLTQTSLRVSVKPGHAYRWWVHKVVGSQPSAPAVASFRVGECDAAEVVRFYVPEILEPGKETVVSVTVRNVGSKTWKPELGYKLGAQNPQDNALWGTNRAAMHASSQTRPGETHTFEWLIRAPQPPGVYNFQWRMLCEGVHWFGARMPNRCIHVKARGAGGSWLTRDTKSGLLKQPTGNIVTFRGGHYHLFEKTGAADRALVYNRTDTPIRLDFGAGRPCAPYRQEPPQPGDDPPLPAATLKSWPGESALWAELFTFLRQHGINILRIFLTNGFGIQPSGTREVNFEVYPFNTVEVSESDPATPRTKVLKWKIRDAITNPLVAANWNVNYFTRLRAFSEEARKAGVYLQLSLFNYYELNSDAREYDPWEISIWNPARCFEAAWGTAHLVNPSPSGQGQRQLFFIAPPAGSGLRLVQEQMVRKVVRELCCFPNIILEVMNEPHRGTHQESSKFSSEVVGWIIDEGGKCLPAPWRPLISVNASLRPFDPNDMCREISDTFDVDWWAEHSDPTQPDYVKNYEEVDVISYHGLTGYGVACIDITCKCLADGCKQRSYQNVQFPAVDLDSISNRFCDFYGSGRMRAGACDSFGKHPNKALMMSTDAVNVGRYTHKFGPWDMNLRDGQITTGLGNAEGTPEEKRTRSDLENWAFWCFCVARSNGGVIHFQNHSTYEDTYPAINKAFRDSLGSD